MLTSLRAGDLVSTLDTYSSAVDISLMQPYPQPSLEHLLVIDNPHLPRFDQQLSDDDLCRLQHSGRLATSLLQEIDSLRCLHSAGVASTAVAPSSGALTRPGGGRVVGHH